MYYGTDYKKDFNYDPHFYRDQTPKPIPQKLLDLLTEALKDEKHDRAKYKIMMDMAPNEKVRRQIQYAYDDEGKHYKLFQQILYQLTGRMIDVPAPDIEKYDCFLDAVESSINGELEAADMYVQIHNLLPDMKMKDILHEIITDEQEHAARFIYLYSMLK